VNSVINKLENAQKTWQKDFRTCYVKSSAISLN